MAASWQAHRWHVIQRENQTASTIIAPCDEWSSPGWILYLELSTSSAKAPKRNSWVVLQDKNKDTRDKQRCSIDSLSVSLWGVHTSCYETHSVLQSTVHFWQTICNMMSMRARMDLVWHTSKPPTDPGLFDCHYLAQMLQSAFSHHSF